MSFSLERSSKVSLTRQENLTGGPRALVELAWVSGWFWTSHAALYLTEPLFESRFEGSLLVRNQATFSVKTVQVVFTIHSRY